MSVVLSTFNRAELLGPAVGRLLSQTPSTPPYEVVVVDNASTDDTPHLVRRLIDEDGGRLRYVLEPRQGLSYARNAGIEAARSDIVAFTDDDVRVADDWVEVIHATFDEHPEVDCLGGRTLPDWPSSPPSWLTRLHWVGPLALQDYGEQPFVVDKRKALCLAGANFAFRKQVFARIGQFSPEFPRSEDTELMIRLWLSGARALYVPGMISHAAVQSERLEKNYHRAWHYNIGRCNARMRFEELTAADGGLRPLPAEAARIGGVPLFAVRQLVKDVLSWIVQASRRSASEAFWYELQVRALLGYIRESRALHRKGKRPPSVPPVVFAPLPVKPREAARPERMVS